MRGGRKNSGKWRGGIDWKPLLASMALHFLAVALCGWLLPSAPLDEPEVQVAEVTLTFPKAQSTWDESDEAPSTTGASGGPMGEALPGSEEAPGLGGAAIALETPLAPLATARAGAPISSSGPRNLPSDGSGGNSEADERLMREDIERWEASLPPSGPTAEITLFDAKLSGHSFVFVIDRSASTASKHAAACAEIERKCAEAINALPEVNRFQVILYNDRVSSHRGLRLALPKEKEKAKERLLRFPPSGGTMHVDGLRAALLLRANAVCWFSDGGDPDLTPAQIEELALLAARSKTVIHAWRLGERPGEGRSDFMRLLAERTGGHFYEGLPKPR